MRLSPRPLTAVLDANVLYPASLRDYLLSLADVDLYQPKWSDIIHDEWIGHLLENNHKIRATSLKNVVDAMNRAFPDANVSGFQHLINKISLPDQNDRHVLAAAIKAQAAIIVTSNLKDFPMVVLKGYKIEVLNPDDFIVRLLRIDPFRALEALHNQVERLKNPPMTIQQVISSLAKHHLIKSLSIIKLLL